MANSYKCKNCGLYFVSGWFHFHNEDKSKPDSTTYIVCIDCGCNYYILHYVESVDEFLYFIGKSIDKSIDVSDVLENVVSKDGTKCSITTPFVAGDTPESDSEPPPEPQKENIIIRTLQYFFRLKMTPEYKTYDFGKFKCLNCNQERRLVRDYPFVKLCPNCTENTLESIVFMT